ncbi:MAG: cytochrome c [Ottowia sp.]|uniref:c-type cytochrome n=1 Tax=Ottowia sp. TaxID=1898956 RepID=UPI0039E28A59
MSKFLFAGALATALLAGAPFAQAQSGPQAAAFSASNARFTQQGGETLYRSICQGCHMPGGEGAYSGAGFFPDLRKNTRLAAAPYGALVVLNGLHGMPPFGAWLDDQQVADVVNYIRTAFGNQYSDALSPQAVAGLRTPTK